MMYILLIFVVIAVLLCPGICIVILLKAEDRWAAAGIVTFVWAMYVYCRLRQYGRIIPKQHK
jgi:preprotein translocase subunit SecG